MSRPAPTRRGRACLRLLALCLNVRRNAASMVRGAPPPGGASRGLKAKQSLGQNFLQDVGIARRIAASLVDESENGIGVIELGPGQGALTGHLLERFPEMTAVELDQRDFRFRRRERAPQFAAGRELARQRDERQRGREKRDQQTHRL